MIYEKAGYRYDVGLEFEKLREQYLKTPRKVRVKITPLGKAVGTTWISKVILEADVSETIKMGIKKLEDDLGIK